MPQGKPKALLEERRTDQSALRQRGEDFRVRRVYNSVSLKIGQLLTETEAQNLLAQGWDIQIDAPK